MLLAPGVGDNGVALLQYALDDNYSITSLDLSCNDLGEVCENELHCSVVLCMCAMVSVCDFLAFGDISPYVVQ